jgi:hypothetical protein
VVHTHASRAPSFLMFPRLYSLFFSRMLCCDTPMTLGLGFSRAAAAWILTRNRGSRMNGMEMNTSQGGAGGRGWPHRRNRVFLGACARLHGEPYIFLFAGSAAFMLFPVLPFFLLDLTTHRWIRVFDRVGCGGRWVVRCFRQVDCACCCSTVGCCMLHDVAGFLLLSFPFDVLLM